jgi:cell division protein FtsL
MHARIEKIAARNLNMRVPTAARIQVLGPLGEDTR